MSRAMLQSDASAQGCMYLILGEDTVGGSMNKMDLHKAYLALIFQLLLTQCHAHALSKLVLSLALEDISIALPARQLLL